MVFRPLSSGAALFVLTAGAALFITGCSSQAQENAAAPTTATAQNDAAPAEAPASTTTAPAATTPAKTYRVSDPPQLGPSAPPNIRKVFDAGVKKSQLPPPPASFKVAAHPRVEFDTNQGKIILELDATKAPLNTKSFVYLCSKGFYKGTVFHRREDLIGGGKGWIVQGGDPLSADPHTFQFAGGGGPGYEVPLEISDLKHDPFVIAAARTNDPDSAGGQFYITQGAPHFLDGEYTVFGKVVEGKDVAAKLKLGDKLLAVKVLEASTTKDAPKAP